MPHRTFVRLLYAFGLLVALLTATAAQPPKKVVRVGLRDLVNPRTSPFVAAFEQRLREHGYVEGQNLIVEFRTAEGQLERLSDLAAELVRLPVDVLVAPRPEATLRAARQATRTVPLVMIAVNYDPWRGGTWGAWRGPRGTLRGCFS